MSNRPGDPGFVERRSGVRFTDTVSDGEVLLTTLSDIRPEAPPTATVVDGRILCDDCGAPADTIHLIPWVTDCKEVKAACPKHDPDGYWFTIEAFHNQPVRWLLHLVGKNNGPDTVDRLLWWLDYPGAEAIEEAKPAWAK